MSLQSKKIRAFAAIDPSSEMRREAGRVQRELSFLSGRIKWVDQALVHLTLKFLGNISEDKLDQAIELIRPVASVERPFVLGLERLGVFPSFRKPRVIWTGVGDGSENIIQLAGTFNEILGSAGFKTEKRTFTPHFTIGRIKSLNAAEASELEKVCSTLRVRQLETIVKNIVFYKSYLTSSGPLYRVAEKITFS